MTNPHEFTMNTVEGRPNVDVDWQAEYAKQRRSRLEDSIHEYLEDDDVSILEFYNDVKDIIEDIVSYHESRKEKAAGALQLIHGHRPVNFEE